MTWFIVNFDDDNTVEAVPDIWYEKKKSQCYWPPKGTTKAAVMELIKKKHPPEKNYILYRAHFLGVYDDYKKAQQKANKAKDTNILSSNNETLQDNCKRKKRKRRNLKKFDLSEDESSETEMSSDDTTYPNVPNEMNIVSSDSAKSNTDNDNQLRDSAKSNTDNSNQLRDSAKSNTDNSNQLRDSAKSNTDNNNQLRDSATKSTCDTEKACSSKHRTDSNTQSNTPFERILRELHIITLKIDDMSESLNIVLKNKAEESQKSVVSIKVPDIIQSFPVNHDTLIELENWLTSCEENKTLLAQNLSRIGGSTVKEIVRRLMYHIFTNEVGMSYSWDGAKKKEPFKNLAVATVILSAVRRNKKTQEATDAEIIIFIKAWLVRCKDRLNNKNKTAPEEEPLDGK